MDTQKVIIKKYSFENEVGLSTYDLNLISKNKIRKENKSLGKRKETKAYTPLNW